MGEILQKGNSPTIPVTADDVKQGFKKAGAVLLGGGAAGVAADALTSTPKKREAAATYKSGGLVWSGKHAKDSTPIK